MTPAERNQADATDTLKRYVCMLGEMNARIIGWEQVALVLAECASEALARAAQDRGPNPP